MCFSMWRYLRVIRCWARSVRGARSPCRQLVSGGLCNKQRRVATSVHPDKGAVKVGADRYHSTCFTCAVCNVPFEKGEKKVCRGDLNCIVVSACITGALPSGRRAVLLPARKGNQVTVTGKC